MKSNTRSLKVGRGKGLAIIEFTIVSTVLLIVLFGIMELSRFVFSLQMLNEVTRKAARIAAVCYVTEGAESGIPSSETLISIAPIDYKPSMLKIDYLDINGQAVDTSVFNNVSDISAVDEEFVKIRYVRAKIEGFSFGFSLLSTLLGSADSPSFQTIIPAESLGVYRPIGESEIIPTGSSDCLSNI